ncbi:MAG: HD domain-containing protein [Syntrophobacterales bacterium]|nr:HD domain-containing protein [Syntrophobacterales bacterium]
MRGPKGRSGSWPAELGGAAVRVPTWAECLALMEEFGMLPHIREHCFMVQAVARELGRALAAAGMPVHLPLIVAGALLHDLGKTPCLGTGEDHARFGAGVLAARGYPEVARVVAQHIHLEDLPAPGRPIREAEVVNYADKRVLHTRVVPLAERFADLKRRYGRTPEHLARISYYEERSRRLEERLFAPLSLTPDDLLHLNDRRMPWQSSGSP